METKTILVAGATGQQGGAVARALLSRGQTVRALTRNPETAKPLAALGAEALRGDLMDRGAIEGALRGADGFFLVTTPFDKGFGTLSLDDEVRQGTVGIDAAKGRRVSHVVLTSVASADRDTGIPHFETKATVERHLRASGLPATIVRPVAFMDNYVAPWLLPMIQSGTLAMRMRPSKATQLVAVRDIGEFVARRFESPEGSAGQTIELAGDAKTMPEVATALSAWIGRPVQFAEVPDEQAAAQMGEDGVKMARWMDRVGYDVDVAGLENRWGQRMTRFEEFLREIEAPRGDAAHAAR